MRKTGLGGVSPFDIRTRPNVFTPLDSTDTINRKGESVIWLRFQPCPCPAQDRVPNCQVNGCFDGYIRTTEESVKIIEEPSWKVELNTVYTRYSPIHSVESCVRSNDSGGENLTVKHINEDHIIVNENLKFWHLVTLNYRVKLSEEENFEVEGNGERVVELGLLSGSKILLEIISLFDSEGKPLKWVGHTFNSITFNQRIFGKITGRIKTFSAIKIGYKTSKTDPRSTEQAGIKYNAGDIDLVPPYYVNLGEGDILTFLYNVNRTSQYVPYKTGLIDRLTHAPINKVINCYSKNGNEIVQHFEGQDFVLLGYDRLLWMEGKKPSSGYSIMYDYHLSFRVTGFVEGGQGEDRSNKPRLYKAKVITSYNSLGSK
jgi:hypothetical protein